jgi:hypothetical protein
MKDFLYFCIFLLTELFIIRINNYLIMSLQGRAIAFVDRPGASGADDLALRLLSQKDEKIVG